MMIQDEESAPELPYRGASAIALDIMVQYIKLHTGITKNNQADGSIGIGKSNCTLLEKTDEVLQIIAHRQAFCFSQS